jgi:hypothetical protein
MSEEAKGFALKFREVILDNSIEKYNFSVACLEWYKIENEIVADETINSHCVCGHYIKNIYKIYHKDGYELSPIGSECIKRIGTHNDNIEKQFKRLEKEKNKAKREAKKEEKKQKEMEEFKIRRNREIEEYKLRTIKNFGNKKIDFGKKHNRHTYDYVFNSDKGFIDFLQSDKCANWFPKRKDFTEFKLWLEAKG